MGLCGNFTKNCYRTEKRSFVQSFNKSWKSSVTAIASNVYSIVLFTTDCVRPFTQNVDSPVKQGTVKEFVTAILCPYHQVWQELRTCLKKLQFVYDIVERSKSKTIAAHRRFPTDILLN